MLQLSSHNAECIKESRVHMQRFGLLSSAMKTPYFEVSGPLKPWRVLEAYEGQF